MRHIFSFILFFLPLLAFAQFEGKIDMRTTLTETGENAKVEWFIQSSNHLMNINSESKDQAKMQYGLLIKEKQQETWFLSENDNSVYQFPYQTLNRKDLGLPLNSTIKITEEKKKIAGFDCTRYQIISATVTVDCWIGEETGLTHSDFPEFMRNGSLFGVMRLNGIKGIPLIFEVKNLAGDILNGQYIDRITAQKLSADKFKTPSN